MRNYPRRQEQVKVAVYTADMEASDKQWNWDLLVVLLLGATTLMTLVIS